MGVVLVAVGVLVISACESGGTTSTSGFQVSTVARNTIEAGTARLAGTSEFQTSSGTQTGTIAGEIDFANRRASFDFAGKDAKGRSQVSHARTIGDATYTTDSNPAARSAGSKKPWSRFDYGRPQVGITDLGDVSKVLGAFARSGWHRERVGGDEVRGVATEHYRFTYDNPAAPSKQELTLKRELPEVNRYDIWADAQQRIRRFSQSTRGRDLSGEMAVDIFDFGAPVTIDAPPAEQVSVDGSFAPTGPWREIQHGSAGGSWWKLSLAPAKHGRCLRLTTGNDATPSKTQNGARTSCSSGRADPPGEVGDRMDAIESSAATLPNGMGLLYGRVDPNVSALTLHFVGGRLEHVTPDHASFAIAMAADDLVESIELQLHDKKLTCALERETGQYPCENPNSQAPTTPAPTFPGEIQDTTAPS